MKKKDDLRVSTANGDKEGEIRIIIIFFSVNKTWLVYWHKLPNGLCDEIWETAIF